jgi:hypothetical protein
MRIMVRGINGKLKPTQFFIPAGMILMVVCNESGTKVSGKPFAMRRLVICRVPPTKRTWRKLRDVKWAALSETGRSGPTEVAKIELVPRIADAVDASQTQEIQTNL